MKTSWKLLLTISFLGLTISLSAQTRESIFIHEDLQLLPLTENLYLHLSWMESEQYGRFSSNGIVYIQDGKALIIDTPMEEEITKLLAHFIRDSLKATISIAIPGHFHDDCLAGLPYLHSLGAKSIASKLTKDICKMKGLVIPQKSFKKKKNIRFQGKKIVCHYFGPGHAPDNIVVWFPAEKILFGGCLIRPLAAKGMGNTGDAVLAEWGPTVAKIQQALPAIERVIPGHGLIGDVSLLEHTIKLAKAANDR